MKPVKKMKSKNQKLVKKSTIKPKKEQVMIVAQEIKFARMLSGNEKKVRDRVLKTLKKWLNNCFQKGYEFKEDDFNRVWKGLFYAVWMSDKPLVQEELCENIAGILDQFPADQNRYAVMMVKAGLRTLATEWYGIDYHRMDKFLMLVRRYLRGALRTLHRCQWDANSCKKFGKMLSSSDGILAAKTPLYARNATSMIMHFIDCFIEELAKVSEGDIPDASLIELLRPFCSYMCNGEVTALITGCRRVLTALVRQSDAGLRYEDATEAWKSMGCPRGGPEALALESDDDDEQNADGDEQNGDDDPSDDDDDNEKPLDPRAGRVDVVLPCLPVPANMIADMLREMLASTSSKAYKRTKICLERFEQLAKDEYPLPVKDVYGEEETPSWKPTQAAKRLRGIERQLVAEADELALRGLSRKHRKRLLAKSRSGASIVDDVAQITANESFTNGDWTVETTEPEKENNKENIKRNIKRKLETETPILKKKQKIDKNKDKKRDGDSNSSGRKRDKKLKGVQNAKNTKSNSKVTNVNILKNNNKATKLENKSINEKTTKIVEININNKEVKATINSVSKIAKKENSQLDKTTNIVEKTTKSVENTTKLVENVKNTNGIGKIIKSKKLKTPTSPKYEKASELSKKIYYSTHTPKKVKFVLKNNSMQGPVEYYKSVRQSPSIPFDGTKRPTKTNLKPSTPSPINPFFKKKMKFRK